MQSGGRWFESHQGWAIFLKMLAVSRKLSAVESGCYFPWLGFRLLISRNKYVYIYIWITLFNFVKLHEFSLHGWISSQSNVTIMIKNNMYVFMHIIDKYMTHIHCAYMLSIGTISNDHYLLLLYSDLPSFSIFRKLGLHPVQGTNWWFLICPPKVVSILDDFYWSEWHELQTQPSNW